MASAQHFKKCPPLGTGTKLSWSEFSNTKVLLQGKHVHLRQWKLVSAKNEKGKKKMARLRHFEKGVSLKTNKTHLIYIQQRKKKYSNNAKLFHYNRHYLWAKVQYLCSTSCARTTTCCTVLPGWNGELIVFAVLGIKRLRHILWKPSFQTWQQQQTNRTFVLTGNSSII